MGCPVGGQLSLFALRGWESVQISAEKLPGGVPGLKRDAALSEMRMAQQ